MLFSRNASFSESGPFLSPLGSRHLSYGLWLEAVEVRVGKFLPLDGKKLFFHGKNRLAKIVFVDKNWFFPLVGKITIKSILCNCKTKSEILF